MIHWKAPVLCRRQVEPRASQPDAAMLMDVGHRLLGSLRQVDSRRRTFSCNSPHAYLLTAHLNIPRADVGTSFRQRVFADEKLVKLLGAIFKFGAAFRSWRSWVLAPEWLTCCRCPSHRSLVFPSSEACDIQGVTKNDQMSLAQAPKDEPVLFDVQKCGDLDSFGKANNQRENVEAVHDSSTSNVDAIDAAPNDFDDKYLPDSGAYTNVVVIVFDIETTGFKLSDDRIVEFAAQDLTGGDCSTIQTLVNPERPIPLHASNIHGIYSDMVNKSNIPRWKEVAPVILRFMESRRISGGPIFLVAHNGKRFDVPFLLKEFGRCSLQIPSWWQFVDSVPIAREAMKAKGEKGFSLSLSALYEHYKLPFVGPAHRALADVHMLAFVLQKLMVDLEMPASEFVKRSFAIKDILGSSALSTDLEPLSQEFEMSTEFSAESEELEEGLCESCEPRPILIIPWDDDKIDQPSRNTAKVDLQDGRYEESAYFSDFVEAKDRMQTAPNIKNNESHGFKGGDIVSRDNAHNFSYQILKFDKVDLAQLNPVLQQYVHLKLQRPERLLLWKSGDFYQAFFEDAKVVSEMCNVALVAIKGGESLDGLMPMASLHNREVDMHIQVLLAQGVTVLKKDQVSKMGHYSPSQMQFSTVLTPGTARIGRILNNSFCHLIVACVPSNTKDGTWGLAYTDFSTGDINATEGQGQCSLIEEILALHPSEIIFSENANLESTLSPPPGLPAGFCYSSRPASEFCLTFYKKKLQHFFGVDSVEHVGLGTLPVAACAVGGLLGYFDDVQYSLGIKIPFQKINPYFPGDFMLLDSNTRSCLEVFKTKRQGQFEGSLAWALDHTKTHMGKRLLKSWLLRPLLDSEEICTRLNAVEVFLNDSKLREQVRHDLSLLNDFERLAKAILLNQSSPWDLLALGQSISTLRVLSARLEGSHNPYFSALENGESLQNLGQKILNFFKMDALQSGWLLKDNVDSTLDALRSEMLSLDIDIKNLEKAEQDRTMISSLQIVKIESGDHVISVKKCEVAEMPVPDGFQLHASETSEHELHFVTASLLEHDEKRLELITKTRLQENEICKCLRDDVLLTLKELQTASKAIAAIDVLSTFADVSVSRKYCKPVIIKDSREITVMGGRHPVAEILQPERRCFYANSLYMGFQTKVHQNHPHYSEFHELSALLPEECWPRPDILILTGPPASGKSCYVRQAGLIQLLAQIGSYVPAEEAILGIADAIFMKVDNCDEMFTCQSRFELDMKSYANILRNATSHSLILLDGASNAGNTAITRAILEFLALNVKARTLVTTYNSSLRSLEHDFPNVANFQCVNNVDPMFSYSMKPGLSSETSSVLALDRIEGFPEWVSNRASQLRCKEDATEEEALQPEQLLHTDAVAMDSLMEEGHDQLEHHVTADQPSQLEWHMPLDSTAGEDHTRTYLSPQLEQHLPPETISGEESLQCEKKLPKTTSGEEFLQHEKQLTASATGEESLELKKQLPKESSSLGKARENLASSSEGERRQDSNHPSSSSGEFYEVTLESQESRNVEEIAEFEFRLKTWRNVILFLQDYPATRALAKQKGTLASIQKSADAWQVHVTTSALFLKKFQQHEHATTLEKAFQTVLQTPVQLKITVEQRRTDEEDENVGDVFHF